MQNNKIFILLPDGIGLRNFAFTNFYGLGLEKGFDIKFWNNTPFDLQKMGFNEIQIKYAKAHPLTDVLKVAQTHIELSQNIKKTNDKVYDSYRFTSTKKGLKEFLKNLVILTLIITNNSKSGLIRLRKWIAKNERKTKLYFDSLETLQNDKPSMVFCTNQRVMLAVAPILAAQDLGIPTATFIFSWDNLPKGTKIIETDFYFVWSEHMKSEMQFYYPHISENQIKVTGTPQFESHFQNDCIISKDVFFKQHNLNIDKKYICYSGDDITTSPNDPTYLADLANAIITLNKNGQNLGVIFRRCPVDFSSRFDTVLEKYKDIITSINPKWKKIGDSWNTILPTKEDLVLQMNTIFHSELVINLGSSMVFDFVAFNKPCGYINYDVPNVMSHKSVKDIYDFIHFRSMPSNDAVFWINNSNEMEQKVLKMLGDDSSKVIKEAQKWFEKINQHPPEEASSRIWNAIKEICKE